MGTRRGCLFGCLGALAAPWVVFLGLPYVVPDPGGPAMPNVRRLVPDVENGYHVLIEAGRRWPGELVPAGDYGAPYLDEPGTGRLLLAAKPALARLDEALGRPVWQAPVGVPGAEHPELRAARGMARLLVCRGLRRAAAGDLPGGLRDLAKPLALGGRLRASEGGTIPLAAGLACEQMAARGMLACLGPLPWIRGEVRGQPPFGRPPALSAEDRAALREARDLLLADRWTPADRARLWPSLYAEQEAYADVFLDQVAADRPWLAPLLRVRTPIWDSRHSLGVFRRTLRELEGRSALPAAQRDAEALFAIRLLERRRAGYNQAGIEAAAGSARILVKLLAKDDLATAARRAVAAQIAVRLFCDRTARPPRDWDDLVAAGDLPGVPVDPLTGTPFAFDAERLEVRSTADEAVRALLGDEELVWRAPYSPAPRR